MYSQLFLLVIAAVLPASFGQPEVTGTLVSFPMFAAFSTLEVSCNATSIYGQCKDCRRVQNCVFGSPDERDCRKLFPEKPFCNNGFCTATHPNPDVCPAQLLNCTSEGFYPDPYSCQMYHHCEQTGSFSSVYKCPTGYVYNAETFLCKQQKVTADCVTVKCDPNVLVATYGTNKTYYGYCKFVDKVVDTIQVFKCPDNYKINKNICEFECPKEGNFAHTTPNKYYQCYYSNSKLVFIEQTCVTGRIFDKTMGICVTPPKKV